MARLLSPKEFGLVGMISVFIAVSNSLVDSGFQQSLIRKKECTPVDYSTVFYFNLIMGLLLYGLLCLAAPYIASFYDEPRLTPIIRVQGVIVLLNSLTLIQRTVLTKRLDFKLQTKISVTAILVAGSLGIFLAYEGFGVWSIVYKSILISFLTSFMLWCFNRWRPVLCFNPSTFKEHYRFGYKLMLSGLLNTLWKNIYILLIGKFYSAEALGFYSRAKMFRDLPSQNISSVISRVSYPVLSQLQDDNNRLKTGYTLLIQCTTFITLISMMMMAATAPSLILFLLGPKWIESIWMLQIISFAGMLYPLHELNLNVLKVKGRSDLFLKLEIYKKLISLPAIFAGLFFGIEYLLFGMVANSCIVYFLNSYWSGKFIGYPTLSQLNDILPSLIFAACISFPVYLLGHYLIYTSWLILLIQLILGGVLTLFLGEITRIKPYMLIKNIVLSKIVSRYKKA